MAIIIRQLANLHKSNCYLQGYYRESINFIEHKFDLLRSRISVNVALFHTVELKTCPIDSQTFVCRVNLTQSAHRYRFR